MPNGDTLISDSNGNRLLMVEPDGSVRWSTTIDTPYEAEKLGTGDESTNGSSVSTLGLEGNQLGESPAEDSSNNVRSSLLLRFFISVRDLLPSLLVNAILYVLPVDAYSTVNCCIYSWGMRGYLGWGGVLLVKHRNQSQSPDSTTEVV